MMLKAIADLLREKPAWSVRPDATVLEAAQIMAERNVGALAVLAADGALIGIFTERDVMARVVARNLAPAETRVAAAMTRDPHRLAPGDTVFEALELMHSAACRHVPVVDRGRYVGMVSMRDIPLANLLQRQQLYEGQGSVGRTPGAD
jgi:CBS domain-containing protein